MAEGKKGRKVGRTARNGQNAKYKNSRRREQNKRRRILRHLRRYGWVDTSAVTSLHRCEDQLGVRRTAA